MYTSLDIANVFYHEAICVKEKSTHFNLPKLLLETIQYHRTHRTRRWESVASSNFWKKQVKLCQKSSIFEFLPYL